MNQQSDTAWWPFVTNLEELISSADFTSMPAHDMCPDYRGGKLRHGRRRMRGFALDKLRFYLESPAPQNKHGIYSNEGFNWNFIRRTLVKKFGFKTRPKNETKLFTSNWICWKDEIYLDISEGKTYLYSTPGHLMVELNPNYWHSFADLLAFLKKLIVNFDPLLTTIVRADAAVTLPLPFQTLRALTYVRYVRKNEKVKYGSNLDPKIPNSGYFGEETMFVVYDKKRQLKLPPKAPPLSRIEIRKDGAALRKMNILSLSDLWWTDYREWFRNVLFPQAVVRRTSTSKFRKFAFRVHEIGFQLAYREANRQHNGSRDILSIAKPMASSMVLKIIDKESKEYFSKPWPSRLVVQPTAEDYGETVPQATPEEIACVL